MSDTVKTWIEERRTIHTKATDVLLRNSYELERETDLSQGDTLAIEDAYNMFPRALDSLNKVLELHKPFEWSFGYGPVYSCEECSRLGGNPGKEDEAEWPCATVQTIEGAINGERG